LTSWNELLVRLRRDIAPGIDPTLLERMLSFAAARAPWARFPGGADGPPSDLSKTFFNELNVTATTNH
jgi:hypothetical protein